VGRLSIVIFQKYHASWNHGPEFDKTSLASSIAILSTGGRGLKTSFQPAELDGLRQGALKRWADKRTEAYSMHRLRKQDSRLRGISGANTSGSAARQDGASSGVAWRSPGRGAVRGTTSAWGAARMSKRAGASRHDLVWAQSVALDCRILGEFFGKALFVPANSRTLKYEPLFAF
jgi:hypothetical protein